MHDEATVGPIQRHELLPVEADREGLWRAGGGSRIGRRAAEHAGRGVCQVRAGHDDAAPIAESARVVAAAVQVGAPQSEQRAAQLGAAKRRRADVRRGVIHHVVPDGCVLLAVCGDVQPDVSGREGDGRGALDADPCAVGVGEVEGGDDAVGVRAKAAAQLEGRFRHRADRMRVVGDTDPHHAPASHGARRGDDVAAAHDGRRVVHKVRLGRHEERADGHLHGDTRHSGHGCRLNPQPGQACADGG